MNFKRIPNPYYSSLESAPYEIAFCDKHGNGIHTNDMTFRFREEDKDKAVELLVAGDWEALKKLSITPYTLKPFQD